MDHLKIPAALDFPLLFSSRNPTHNLGNGGGSLSWVHITAEVPRSFTNTYTWDVAAETVDEVLFIPID